jgi:spermidine/putrescine transport system substrate-binding protein
MKLKGMLSAALSLLTVLSLTACRGSSGGKPITSSINVYNWGEYIDESVNTAFTKATGIKVNYSNYATNEELYAKLKSGGSEYDVVFPSDYMIGRMISEDMLEKLDFSAIPNAKDLDPKYTGLNFDPTNEYSVPYMWGIVGIVYNKTMVKETVDSWDILWDAKYKDKILMFDNSRDAIGIALKKLGYSFNTTNETELKKAAAELETQKPLVQAYVMDQIFDKMENGEAAVAPYYAGDAISMIQDNSDLAFAVPKEGTNRFVDAMVIPKGSKHKADAEAYINYLCSAGVGVKNCEATGYSTPLTTTFAQLPKDIRDNKFEYPDDTLLGNTEVYSNIPQATLKLYDDLWTQIEAK